MASPALEPGRLVALDVEGLIAADLPCGSCGYLLRAQPPNGVCPECGTAVADTLNASNIRLLPLDWLRRIQAGSVCLAISIPMIWLFGLGVLVWLLGVITLTVEVPKSRPEFKRLQLVIGGSGVLAVIAVLLLFLAEGHHETEWLIFAHLAIVGVLLGVHLGGVLRYASRVCDAASWPGQRECANILALFGLVWPALVLASLLLIGLSFRYAWSGDPPLWLEPLVIALSIPAFLGGIAFAITQFIFWIVIAVRMHRIRKEADVLYHEAKALAANPPQV
ncbi:MAG: hypothetical protein AAGJ38_08950 [Planctomycetota bacterium]